MQLHRGLRKIVRTLGVATGVAMASVAAAEPPCVERWTEGLFGDTSFRAADLLSSDDGSGARIYVGGSFEYVGELRVDHIAAHNGSEWAALGSGLDGDVEALCLFDDGGGPVIVAGGEFSENGNGSLPLPHLAMWNGQSWRAIPDTPTADRVTALALLDTDTEPALFVAFQTDLDEETTVARLARWDGSDWHLLPGEFDNRIQAIRQWDDGTGEALYVCGWFDRIDGEWLPALARLQGDAWVEIGGGLGTLSDYSLSASSMAVYDDGTGPALFVGGGFYGAGDSDAELIAKWDGSEWHSVGHWHDYGDWSYSIDHLLAYDDGSGEKLYIASRSRGDVRTWDGQQVEIVGEDDFSWGVRGVCATSIDGQPVLAIVDSRGLASWDGVAWNRISVPLNGTGELAVLESYDDGNGECLYSAFDEGGRIKYWNGLQWQQLPDLLPYYNASYGRIRDLIVYDDGSGPNLIATGMFFDPDVNDGNIARWDGTAWHAMGNGLSDTIVGWGRSLAVYDSGDGAELYVSGRFTHAGFAPANKIARWDGEEWRALGTGLGEEATKMVVADVGAGPMLYAIGGFAGVDYQPAGYIAAWDGTSWHTLEGGFDQKPMGLAILREGEHDAVYVAGAFTTAGGRPANGFAKWDGEHWIPAAPSPPPPTAWSQLFALNTPAGERLFALGSRHAGDYSWYSELWRLEGDTWISLGTFDKLARDLTTYDDGGGPSLFVGGDFDAVDGIASRGIARRNLCDPDDIAADLDGDGVINQSDLGLLLAAYDTCEGDDFYDDRADLTGDACVDHADLGAFLQAYPQ